MASIKQISQRKYKITVSNGYRSDGRKISRAKTITVPDSVRNRSVGQYVSHAAEEFERFVKNGYSEDGEMTFREYALRWLERQKKYAPSSLASYRRMLEVTFPHIGNIQINRLRPIALENMLAELRKRTNHGKTVQEKTVQKYLTVVSAVLSDAKRNEIISQNPARMIDLPLAERNTQYIPTDEEAHRLLDILANEQELVRRVYYALAIYTGCRRGELCALRWSDIKVNGYTSVLTVSRSRSNVAGKGIQEGATKNKKARTIFLGEDMTNILLTLWYMRRTPPRSNDHIFANEDGSLIHPDTFTKHLRKLFDENGFPSNFHLHTLRHYFVSTMLHNGIDKQTVAELAGHGDTSFLERTYCHPQMTLKQQAAERFERTLFQVGEMHRASAS